MMPFRAIWFVFNVIRHILLLKTSLVATGVLNKYACCNGLSLPLIAYGNLISQLRGKGKTIVFDGKKIILSLL